MGQLKKLIFPILICLAGHSAYSQSDKEKAMTIGQQAITLMDKGQVDESIKLLEIAEKLDPENYVYPYEKAYACYLKKDFKQAIAILEELIKRGDSAPQLFQLLGNSYDMIQKTDKAIAVYDQGLKRYPDAGFLYLEKGNCLAMKGDLGKALEQYETGIRQHPAFPSNYYQAARLFLNSTEEVWGMLYGELFMNLERNTPRTKEISKLLFDTYKSEITFSGDTSYQVSFSQNIVMPAAGKEEKVTFPISLTYEMTLTVAVFPAKHIDIHTLNDIRTRFLDTYYKMGHDQSNPHPLLTYQRKIQDAGHLEAYNYWVLMQGDPDGYKQWISQNKTKWDDFQRWFKANPIKL